MLQQQTSVSGIKARDFLPRPTNSLARVIRGVDGDLSVEDVTTLIRTEVEILIVCQLGEPHTICIVSVGNTLRKHVEVGCMRYSVWV